LRPGLYANIRVNEGNIWLDVITISLVIYKHNLKLPTGVTYCGIVPANQNMMSRDFARSDWLGEAICINSR
jgi:hypothetical protein